MLTIAFVNLKPGTGKTTSAVWLAHAFMETGLRVVLVDADPAASALEWADLAGGFPFKVIGMPGRDIDERTPLLASGDDVVIIDAPQLEDHAEIARSALRAASEVLVPVAPTPIELNRAVPMRDEISADKPVAVLLNRTVAGARSTADARAVLADTGYDVLSIAVPRLELFAQSFGQPVYATATVWQYVAEELTQRANERNTR